MCECACVCVCMCVCMLFYMYVCMHACARARIYLSIYQGVVALHHHARQFCSQFPAYDDYDDFGSAVSPRVGATFTMVDNLVLKASYGQGFRAPDMSDLYGATAFSASSATDYYGCQLDGVAESDCPDRQFDTYIGSNIELGAFSNHLSKAL